MTGGRRTALRAATGALAALAVAGCGAGTWGQEQESASTTPDVAEVDDDRGVLLRGAYLQEPPDGARAWAEGSDVAVQGRLLNEAAARDAVLSASSPAAAGVDLVDPSGAVVGSLPLPPGEPVDLRPGGPTLVLRDVQRELPEGEQVQLTLVLREAGELPATLQVLIEDPAAG
ncbi:copper chaperone PCu(A)C [Vallicoccus soli]|nr:copper chaperone PCu(A)C [Vallicoccus soli]